MAVIHDAGLQGSAPILSLAQLSQWKVDHEREDERQFSSIDRKLNWLIAGIVTVLLAIVGAMAHELWAQRSYVPPAPPAIAAR